MLGSDKQDNKSPPPSSLEEIKGCHSVIIMPKVYGKNKVLWTTGGYSVEGIEFHHQKSQLHLGYVLEVKLTIKGAEDQQRCGENL